MTDVLATHTSILLAQIERLKAIYPELEDDAELLADTIEGSTTFENVLDRLAVAFMSKVALKEANAAVQSDLRDRGARFDRGAEALKALMFAIMKASGKQKVVLPSATVSVARSRPRLVIDDDFNAQGFVKIERTPMRADIAAALAAGDEIAGARLEPVNDHLSVRTK